MLRVHRICTVALLALTLTAVSTAAHAEWEITITNATINQIVSPPIVVSHDATADLWEVGQEASAELAALAEDADSSGLLALLGTLSEVNDFDIAGDVLVPGASMTLTIESGERLSALGMLVTTNDTFFGLDSAPISGDAAFYTPAYDAGSERNTQRCAHIPGPPCAMGGVRVTDGAEGFVSISPGIQMGRGQLDTRRFGWDNPVVKITVKEVIPGS